LKRATLVGVLALLVASPASALLIDNGDITTDDAANMEWLDLTLTQGLTTAEALAANPGFVVATIAQVETLYTNAGFATLTNIWNDANAPGAIALMGLMGCTDGCASGNFPKATGFVADGGSLDVYGFDAQLSSGVIFRAKAFNTSIDGASGHYLVRPSIIPEPSTALLLGLGLVGMGLGRRRR